MLEIEGVIGGRGRDRRGGGGGKRSWGGGERKYVLGHNINTKVKYKNQICTIMILFQKKYSPPRSDKSSAKSLLL